MLSLEVSLSPEYNKFEDIILLKIDEISSNLLTLSSKDESNSLFVKNLPISLPSSSKLINFNIWSKLLPTLFCYNIRKSLYNSNLTCE